MGAVGVRVERTVRRNFSHSSFAFLYHLTTAASSSAKDTIAGTKSKPYITDAENIGITKKLHNHLYRIGSKSYRAFLFGLRLKSRLSKNLYAMKATAYVAVKMSAFESIGEKLMILSTLFDCA